MRVQLRTLTGSCMNSIFDWPSRGSKRNRSSYTEIIILDIFARGSLILFCYNIESDVHSFDKNIGSSTP